MIASDGRGADDRQTCLRCVHYYITYDPSFPYGCRALGFKSRRMPQLEVVEASQASCLSFQPKKK